MAGIAAAVALAWRRRARGLGPSRRSQASKLEIGYVVLLLGMMVFLVDSSFTANGADHVDPKPAMRVEVIAFQWCWRFHYEGTPVTTVGECEQPGGVPLPTLVLPAGTPVELDVTSRDVVHAFWVPHMRFKMYAYPDHTNSFTVTMPAAGRWIGRCAQLCGLYHSTMDFWLQVVSPAAFSRFLRTRALPGVIAATGAAA
jgi:cytochrome c oxidase subunit 2